jgi:porphyrinogen peroxidase
MRVNCPVCSVYLERRSLMVMTSAQPGILAPLPRVGRYLAFTLSPAPGQAKRLRTRLQKLAPLAQGGSLVLGLGADCIEALGGLVPGMREFPALHGPQNGRAQDATITVPSTPAAVLCWLRGADTGQLVLLTRQIEQVLAPVFELTQVVDGFAHHPAGSRKGHDLTGYEDGTENPKGQKAATAALVQGQGAGLDGSSFMAVQQWVHDLAAFEAMKPAAQDRMIGRQRSDNAELPTAPPSAHVKRTEQERFNPPAFVLRRSMPWATGNTAGLMFVAFGKSLDAFEVQMRRMVGEGDGVVDALFQISKPVSGAYYWCPPLGAGGFDWRAI